MVARLVCLFLLAIRGAQAKNTDEDIHLGDTQDQLNKLLAWSIEHSNLEELKAQASEDTFAEKAALTAQRAAELREMMKQMSEEPSDRELMSDALTIAGNASASREQRQQALTALRYLLEPIDNAMSLPALGGLDVLVSLMQPPTHPSLQAEAAFALGTAASNNLVFQNEALKSPHLVPALVKGTSSNEVDVVQRSLYAVAALIRNSNEGQRQFYDAEGPSTVAQLVQPGQRSSVLRKAVSLFGDLAEIEGRVEGQHKLANSVLLEQLLGLITHPDQDIQERALLTLIHLARNPEVPQLLKSANIHTRLQNGRERYQILLQDSDAEGSQAIHELSILLSDLEEAVEGANSDRTEL